MFGGLWITSSVILENADPTKGNLFVGRESLL